MHNTDEAAQYAADALLDNGDDGKVPGRGPYGKLRNDVARDKRLTDAHLVALAYRCTWADDKSDVRLDPPTFYKVVRGRGLGRNVAERVVADLQELQYLERHQPEPVNVGGKFYSEKAVDKLLPAAIADDTDYRVVERSWFKGQFALEELAAFLLLRAGTGEGPRTYGRELKERFGWGRDVTARTLRALSGLNMAAKADPRDTDGTFMGACWGSGHRETGHRPRGFRQRGFRREGHIRKDSSTQDPLNEGSPPFGGSVAQARRAPEDDVRVVEPEIIEPAKGKAIPRRMCKANNGEAHEANDGYGAGKSMTLQQAMDKSWSPGKQGLLIAQQLGFNNDEAIEIFDAFKGKYSEGGVAERTKSSNWWKPWEAYVKSWSRNNRRRPNGGSARGGRADRSAFCN